MRSSLLALAGLAASAGSGLAAEPAAAIPPLADQVEAAVLAAPAEKRAGARVLAYDLKGVLVEARAGEGDLVCLADDPKKAGFSAACYHVELEPYMARGRALRKEGIDGHDNRKKRWAEIEAGELSMPKGPRMLYVLHGERFDATAGEVVKPFLRWVVFTPYATPESTGLSLESAPGAPWLMFPGTPGAHIMITPPRG